MMKIKENNIDDNRETQNSRYTAFRESEYWYNLELKKDDELEDYISRLKS